MASSDRSARDPAAIEVGVILAYGGAMWQVQIFERNLALLALTLEKRRWRRRRFKTRAQFHDYLEGLLDRTVNAFQRATARQLRALLPEIDPQLLAALESLFAQRDRLAHRFLVEATILDRGDGPRLRPAAIGELIELTQRFQATALELHARAAARIPELPIEGDVPEGVEEAFEDIARAMMLGDEFKVPGIGDD